MPKKVPKKMTRRIKSLPTRKTSRLSVEVPKVDYNSLQPIFSFRHMQYGSKHCLSQCCQDDKSYIVDTLLHLSQFTWREITSMPRKKLGFEHISRNQFSASLPPFVTPDVEKLTVFRYSRAGRIAGMRIHDVYHILIVGPDIYPH
jgi:hypothetical protein